MKAHPNHPAYQNGTNQSKRPTVLDTVAIARHDNNDVTVVNPTFSTKLSTTT